MNVFDDRELAKRLRIGAVSSRERFAYFAILTIVVTIFSLPSIVLLAWEGVNEWDMLIDMATVAATALGIVYCYLQNRAGDDKEFIERWVCIAVPVGVRAFLLGTLLIAWLVLANLVLAVEIPEVTSAWNLVTVVVVLIYFYARLGGSIRIAAD